MRHTLASAAFALFLCLPSCTAPGDPSISLFDGRTLSGWVQRGGQASFRVEDGAIVGATRPHQPNSFLCTTAIFSDFILDLDFKIDPQLNSGVQIRSEARSDGTVFGYQVEIDPSERAWTAGLYDESRRGWLFSLERNAAARFAFRQGEWNHLRIRAAGDHLQTWLNGVAAADLRDGTTREGFIALQVHGVGGRTDELAVRFRNLRLTPIVP